MSGLGNPRPPGLLASARDALEGLLELLQVRLQLLGNELEEQKLRLAQGLALLLLGVLLLALGVVLACGFLLVLFWQEHRLAVLGLMALAVCGGAALLVALGLRRLRSAGAMFEASVGELEADRRALAAVAGQQPAEAKP